jgi:hypothetical protein
MLIIPATQEAEAEDTSKLNQPKAGKTLSQKQNTK